MLTHWVKYRARGPKGKFKVTIYVDYLDGSFVGQSKANALECGHIFEKVTRVKELTYSQVDDELLKSINK